MDELGVSEDTFNNVEQAFDIRSLTWAGICRQIWCRDKKVEWTVVQFRDFIQEPILRSWVTTPRVAKVCT
jgi:hypothetical protein